MRLILRVLLNAFALYIADYLLDDIALTGMLHAGVGGIVLGVINVVNAICFGLAAALVPGFDVAGFWSALGGALILGVVSWILSAAMKDRRHEQRIASS